MSGFKPRRHVITWGAIRWNANCTCSWGHWSRHKQTAEEAVARHLEEARIQNEYARKNAEIAAEVSA